VDRHAEPGRSERRQSLADPGRQDRVHRAQRRCRGRRLRHIRMAPRAPDGRLVQDRRLR
jgi:hypothetical protein